MRVAEMLTLAATASGCRQKEAPPAPEVSSPMPAPAEFGDVIEGLPIVRVGGGHVAAVTDGKDVVLRSLVNGDLGELARFRPGEYCPVVDLTERYFVFGNTCGWGTLALLSENGIECDELVWTGSRIAIGRRTPVVTPTELPPTCR